ncbi:MAG: GtrA family protein [Pseudomonadota bacterium]
MNKLISQLLSSPLMRFIIVGGTATSLHLIIVIVIMETWALAEGLANAIAFALATIFSYLCNTYWSFSAQQSRSVFIKYWLVSALGLSLAVLISSFAAYLGLHYFLGAMMVVSVTPLVSYNLHKRWTYR